MSLNIGPMDRQIVLQEQVAGSPAVSAGGEPNFTWSTFAEPWAARRDLRGEEYFAQFGKQAEVTTVFKIRWLEGVTAQMRIVDGDDVYDIQHIARLGRKDALELWGKATAGAIAP